MNVSIDTSQLAAFANHLDATAEKAIPRARTIVRAQGGNLVNGIVRRAPRDTGDYADSWRLEMDTDRRGNPRATAGTDHPAGFRKERGYHGTDSLGRHFVTDDGHPHVAPAARAAEEPLELAALEILDDL